MNALSQFSLQIKLVPLFLVLFVWIFFLHRFSFFFFSKRLPNMCKILPYIYLLHIQHQLCCEQTFQTLNSQAKLKLWRNQWQLPNTAPACHWCQLICPHRTRGVLHILLLCVSSSPVMQPKLRFRLLCSQTRHHNFLLAEAPKNTINEKLQKGYDNLECWAAMLIV